MRISKTSLATRHVICRLGALAGKGTVIVIPWPNQVSPQIKAGDCQCHTTPYGWPINFFIQPTFAFRLSMTTY
jgi:hypothetical protein